MTTRRSNYNDCTTSLSTCLGTLLDDALSLNGLKLSKLEPLNWKKAIPQTDEPGVYLIFDRDQNLIYVGKAERPLGFEVWSKFIRGEDDDQLLWKDGPRMQSQPATIATIAIPPTHSYLAPALEGLLIRELHPELNIHLKMKPSP